MHHGPTEARGVAEQRNARKHHGRRLCGGVIFAFGDDGQCQCGERNRGRRSEQPCKALWLEKISEQRKCGNRYSSNQEANENQFHNAGAKLPPVGPILSPQVNFALPPPRDSSFPKARSNLDENCCEGVV